MASSMSKRNQARNEQALQELIKTVPGNDRCADCQARNPGWASWSLGIFLCMRCAALHRKLGTHISKVKSLSMDSWTNEQVDNMRNIGNDKSNETWNPQRKRAPIPLDVDEVDSAMERFIRQKYEQKVFSSGGGGSTRAPIRSPSMPTHQRDTRPDSPGSLDDNPPPPPPKPGRKFGFSMRSASSGSFLSRGHKKEEKQNKPSNIAPLALKKDARVFGATIGVTESDKGLEMKLIQLQEMGFPDTKRNTTVLKGNGGDLERTIESLVKLGEGQSSSTRSKPAGTKATSPQDFSRASASNGAAVVRSPVSQQHSSPSGTPQTTRSNNPFEAQNQSATSVFDAAMANMTISSPQSVQQQNLFPNATGGHVGITPQIQQARYQQSMTPPVPQTQQFINNPYAQQAMHNPFMAAQPMSPPHSATNPYMSVQNPMSPNPFLQQANQNPMFSPHQSTFSPQEATFSPQQQTFMQSPQTPQQPFNGFFQPQQEFQNPVMAPQSPGNYYNPYMQQASPMMPQATGRLDKNSILALYNYPQMAPSQQGQASQGQDMNATSPTVQQMQSPVMTSPQRSATMPVIGSKNPFAPVGNSAFNPSSLYQQ